MVSAMRFGRVALDEEKVATVPSGVATVRHCARIDRMRGGDDAAVRA